MEGRGSVSALAAWAVPTDHATPTGVGRLSATRGSRFRSALFDDPQGAVSAALLLMSTLPHGGLPPIAIGIAHGAPDRAMVEADALASRAPAGSILLSPAAMEAMAGRLPDGMALRAELLDTDPAMTAFALRSAAEVTPHSLPTPSSRLIGRVEQIRQLREVLLDKRLVTLTGPPGSGKTRLAIEAGRSTLGTFPDGAWFVPLAPIQDEALIANRVARTLGLAEQAGASMAEVVRQHLAGRGLLLIADNFEHLLGGGDVIGDWLAAAPDLHVLITSREPLHLSGEHEVPIPPLLVPTDPLDPDAAWSEAVQLFNERAHAVDPSFEPDEQTLADIVRICRRLDGLPLALELAAARTKALPVAAILRRLGRSMELLTHTARDVPARHRSLQAAVAWSHDLLTPAERVFLRRLSVFRGGWSLDAAHAVTLASEELSENPLELTTSLLDKSLIRRQADSRSEPRYEMLETIREYAGKRLEDAGEVGPAHQRQAGWFLELAERAAPLLTGAAHGEWLDRLELEVDNFRAALRWSIDNAQAETGMRLGAALWRFWQIRARIGEGRQVMAEVLALPAEVDPAVRARALSAAGSLAYWQNDAAACVQLYEASVTLRREIGDPSELASGLYDLGHALSVLDTIRDLERGRSLEEEALHIYQALGDPFGEAWLVWALGWNSYFGGRSAGALAELSDSVERFRALHDSFGLAWGLTGHGLAAARLRDLGQAGASWREALIIFAEADDGSGIETVLEHLARLAASTGDASRAIRLAAAAARVRGVSQSRIAEMQVAQELGQLALPLTPELESVRQEGAAMTTAEAVEYALATEIYEPAGGLHVRALGRMVVERDGRPITRWGGDKAGSRQAQAIFAFLFDRGEAGLEKDEVTELLWPDMAIKRADLAFHRTLGGLRSVLEAATGVRPSVTYEGGRYRVAADVIARSDVGAFEELLNETDRLEGPAAISALEQARGLYRGDLFDDCPLYGDSAFVEDRRAYLRGRFEDLLVALGDRYAELGDTASAAGRYRQALSVNPADPRAAAGIKRLGAVTASDEGV